MEPFCAIIPTRGDRKPFLDHCLWQLDRMTVKPKAVFLINHEPVYGKVDLVARVQAGVACAIGEGIDVCFIVEDDDAYKPDHFKRYMDVFDKADFVGQDYSHYYNLRNRTWFKFTHSYRASLCSTAFRVSALNNFKWPAEDDPFLDLSLWKYARTRRRKFIDTGMVGIKHGMGLCGGKGHRMVMRNKDPDMAWLKSIVDQESFEFYKSLDLNGTQEKDTEQIRAEG